MGKNLNVIIMIYHWQIFGHEKTLEHLEGHLENHSLGHAILLVGPEHIGKFSILKTLSQILQCEKELCRKCSSCQQVERGYHLDTIEMQDDGSSIKIEQIRDIKARLTMTPQSLCKILLLENIGRLTEEAGNSLLKILEEPGPKTYFFFTAITLRDVLPTIQSRMQILRLKAPLPDALFEFLKKRYPSLTNEPFRQLELLSLGKPGKAISLLESPEILETQRGRYEDVKRFCLAFSLTTRYKLIGDLKDDPQATREFLTMMISFLHSLLFTGNPAEKGMACRILPQVVEAYDLMKKNVNVRLLLENIVLNIS